jgi:hypothetical protein
VGVLRYAWRGLWRQVLLGRNARRRANYVELLKRIRNDTHFTSCQQAEIIITVATFSLMILTVQMYMIGTVTDELSILDASVVLFGLFGFCVALGYLAREHALNERATFVRVEIERTRKKPPRRARARKS